MEGASASAIPCGAVLPARAESAFKHAVSEGTVRCENVAFLEECGGVVMQTLKAPLTAVGAPGDGSTSTASSTASTVVEQVARRSDLEKGVYEGGYKVWEGSNDLVRTLQQMTASADAAEQWRGMHVLELGCGHGTPGIYALACGAEHVDFQDYNVEVIEQVTIPNVLINAQNYAEVHGETHMLQRCGFYSGGWRELRERNVLAQRRYDVILTAETLYNMATLEDLLLLMLQHLANDGVVYISTKAYYFGVGGGTDAFEDVVDAYNASQTAAGAANVSGGPADSGARCVALKKIAELKNVGMSNVREILELRWAPAVAGGRQQHDGHVTKQRKMD